MEDTVLKDTSRLARGVKVIICNLNPGLLYLMKTSWNELNGLLARNMNVSLEEFRLHLVLMEMIICLHL